MLVVAAASVCERCCCDNNLDDVANEAVLAACFPKEVSFDDRLAACRHARQGWAAIGQSIVTEESRQAYRSCFLYMRQPDDDTLTVGY